MLEGAFGFSNLHSGGRPLGYESFDDAVLDVSSYIDGYYNNDRPHTHNNGLPPITAEKRQAIINL